VDAERHQRLVPDDAERVRPIGRQDDRDPRFERDPAGFAIEPGFAAPGDDGQRLDIRVRMDPRLIPRR
jgi:hypothetical protein